ncbi:MAG: DUF2147 domain-containing protein [Oceanicoccus sp.]|uniref:hypothetical protein n=1 Tax=Oceanicoccus sp. TaxID=2691044 RepID=UPI002624CDC7|nr:hypothetical protein [Oceanicoccus sp.]MCP3907963.1 DUF2147 domain-containing protein [Oceanicoccus sp.]MDG1772568.1 hypothetical protein [Oceanicoccus sp.]
MRNNILALCLLPSLVLAEPAGLAGLWQHSDQPVIVKMQAAGDGMEGIVHSYSDSPELVGETLFRELRFDKEEQCWRGRVYVKELEQEKNTCLLLEDASQFRMAVTIGFFSKTVIWTRLEAEPSL